MLAGRPAHEDMAFLSVSGRWQVVLEVLSNLGVSISTAGSLATQEPFIHDLHQTCPQQMPSDFLYFTLNAVHVDINNPTSPSTFCEPFICFCLPFLTSS